MTDRADLLTGPEMIKDIGDNLDKRLWNTANGDYQLRLTSRYEVEMLRVALAQFSEGETKAVPVSEFTNRKPEANGEGLAGTAPEAGLPEPYPGWRDDMEPETLAHVDALWERHALQLAAVSVAALQNTRHSEPPLAKDHPYWTPAYQDVLNAVGREITERERATEAERALAEEKKLSEAISRDCNETALERNELRGALAESERRNKVLAGALEALMELEKRGRVMPIGREWDAAREALAREIGESK